mgnify:CR=1 FL=1
MKTVFIISLSTICLSFFSCGNKQPNNQPVIDQLDVELNEIDLSNILNSIDLTKVQRMTQAEYDTLQLKQVEGLQGYDINDLTMGSTLFSNDKGKIVTVHVVTDGEVTQYLLSYDKDGKLLDNLLVAYEDMVEYYSEVSSHINSNKIKVQTVNFTYGDESGNDVQTADTAINSYRITPEFRIVTD